jgi:2-keto-3-deoxy-L-rhamnonate aldolase RhmA
MRAAPKEQPKTIKAIANQLIGGDKPSSFGRNVAEEIMAVDGIDIGWLGHFDLTNSMGIPGQFEHPDFLAAVDRLIAACRAHRKPAGVLAGSVEAAEAWRTRGFRVFAYGTDISLLQQSLRDGLVRLRAGEGR